ncbi:hypothetical protein Sme01_44380 [Sphaerisporangium melleum]|uniref:Uncharacterized protein n=1 Tax=Sphaerisporangium melleum TaxID=321316 RepID=A0A917R0F5_9ACTN|nr:hypothetical protein [Sphaerisporangium melleum]GGK81124.1 hypothetical protein GCM10007964_24730 [Sphaerisporangium melleum]GII71962.1 hypothetical protein Sme01_44380 [Sphaerisporangium melleum]
MSRPIYREEALRRYRVRERQGDRPLVVPKMWFAALWALVAVLGAAAAALTLIQVPHLVTVPATVTGYRTGSVDVIAHLPWDRPAPRAGAEATVRLAGPARPLACQVSRPGAAGAGRLKAAPGTVKPARLAVLSCRVTGVEPRELLRRSGEAVVPTGTVAAGTQMFGDGS